MKNIRVVIYLLLFLCAMFPVSVFATLTTCEEDGTTSAASATFTDATITIPEANLDSSGDYIYYGIDVGVFEKSGTDGTLVGNPLEIPTEDLVVTVTGLDAAITYDSAKIYALGYRILYTSANGSGGIIPADWSLVPDSYYKVDVPAIEPAIVPIELTTCDITGKPLQIITDAVINIPASGLDSTGNYIYYAVDVCVFEKSDDGTIGAMLGNPLEIPTNSLQVTVQGLDGAVTYDPATIYALGYRILYTPVNGEDSTAIISSDWSMVPNSYFKVSKPIITDFTDRVTAANNWIDGEVAQGKYTEEHGQELNKYFPDSEVVCKFVIDPKGKTVDNYDITLDVNSDNTAGIDEIQYIKIVRIDYDGVKGTYVDKPADPEGADKPLCGKYDGSKAITFNIANPGKKVVTVYCKYKIKNPKATSAIPSEFKNRVDIKARIAGNPAEMLLDPLFNTIRLRKARVIYM